MRHNASPMYRAPLQDLQFALDEVIGAADALAECPDFSDYSPELARSVLQEAARLAEGVLDPLYATADWEGAHWSDAGVTTPKGFKAAYQQFVSGGWPQLRAAPAFGGQGMPAVLVAAVEELFASANLAFRLCPMLTQGATEAIAHCGSDAQKDRYLPAMVRGEWTGTMNLTEPQAGSDLSQVRTRAVPQGTHYRIFGQKIFITYGEHDLAANIIHLVLARIEGAPAGVRGISLFIVPKFLVGEDGSAGSPQRLEVRVDRAQARHPRQSDLHHDLRTGRRGGRLSARRSQPRPRVHVRHDECRAPERRPRRLCGGRTRLSARARLGSQPRAGQASRSDREPHRAADHASPRRAAHAADHEIADRGDALSDALYRHSARLGAPTTPTCRAACRARRAASC